MLFLTRNKLFRLLHRASNAFLRCFSQRLHLSLTHLERCFAELRTLLVLAEKPLATGEGIGQSEAQSTLCFTYAKGSFPLG